jgi:uncharacterized phage-associated protein
LSEGFGPVAYNPRKAAQTIAFFALQSGQGTVSVLKAVKLVYLADRESVKRRGHPIQDEPRVSMPHGPVNSTTYDYLSGTYDPDIAGWSEFLTDRENNNVGLTRANMTVDDLDELSRTEVALLSDVWGQFGNMDKWALRDWTHVEENVPEWKDPKGSSRRISLTDIMNAVGVVDADKRSNEYQSIQNARDILASL